MDNVTLGCFLNGDLSLPHYKHHDQLFCYGVVEEPDQKPVLYIWRCKRITEKESGPNAGQRSFSKVGAQLVNSSENMKVRYFLAELRLNPIQTAVLSTQVSYLDINAQHDYYVVSDLLEQRTIGRMLDTVTDVKLPPDNVTQIKSR